MYKGRRTILITGATDGIGLALAQHYRENNDHIIGLGRRELNVLNPDIFSSDNYCQADLAIDGVCKTVEEFLSNQEIESIDILIHNAAIGFYGRMTESPEVIEDLVRVNLKAPISLTHALLPYLRSVDGKLVFISSVVSNLPCPDYAVYGATKAGLDSFARSLRIELEDNISVQVIHPGATRTGMHAKIGLDRKVVDWERFPPAEEVAGKIARAIAKRRRSTTIGMKNKFLRFAASVFPWLFDRISRDGRDSVTVVERPAHKSTCVITGAAEGIGKALAHRFAADGYLIIGVDINKELSIETEKELHRLGADAKFIIADIGSEDGIRTIITELKGSPDIGIFIHNAGISAVGMFEETNLTLQHKVLDINLLAPMRLTSELIRDCNLNPENLVFISSLSKYTGYPSATVYAATKDAIASYARSLRAARWPYGRVLTVFPGPTKTAHARRYSPDNRQENKRMAPEAVANAIFNAVKKRKSVLIPGVKNRMISVSAQIFPRFIERAMRRIFLSPGVPLAGKID